MPAIKLWLPWPKQQLLKQGSNKFQQTTLQVTFRLTRDELKKAHRAAFLSFRTRTERYVSYFSAAGSILLVGEGLFLLYFGRTHAITQLLPLFPIVTVGIGFWRTRTFSSEPDYSEKHRFDLQEYGIFHQPFVGEQMKIPWTKISRYTETKEFFLLMSPWTWATDREPKVSWTTAWRLKPVLFVLPKRVFSPEDIVSFRALAQQKLSAWARPQNLRPLTSH